MNDVCLSSWLGAPLSTPPAHLLFVYLSETTQEGTQRAESALDTVPHAYMRSSAKLYSYP